MDQAMLFRLRAILLLLLGAAASNGSNNNNNSSGAEFLKAVMSKIHTERFQEPDHELDRGSQQYGDEVGDLTVRDEEFRIVAPTPITDYQSDALNSYTQSHEHSVSVPPLSKDELVSLYQAAINTGSALNLGSLQILSPQSIGSTVDPASNNGLVSPEDHGTLPGYYYYFYPIKTFLKNGMAMAPDNDMQQNANMQENANNMIMADNASPKTVEPLFVAMAGFVGVAMMFIATILFLPKFGALKSRGVVVLKHAPEELAALTRVVAESIEGKDCTERIACEMGRVVRRLQLGNKPIRMLEVMLPPGPARQLAQIRRSASKKEKCNFIPCKRAKQPVFGKMAT